MPGNVHRAFHELEKRRERERKARPSDCQLAEVIGRLREGLNRKDEPTLKGDEVRVTITLSVDANDLTGGYKRSKSVDIYKLDCSRIISSLDSIMNNL